MAGSMWKCRKLWALTGMLEAMLNHLEHGGNGPMDKVTLAAEARHALNTAHVIAENEERELGVQFCQEAAKAEALDEIIKADRKGRLLHGKS